MRLKIRKFICIFCKVFCISIIVSLLGCIKYNSDINSTKEEISNDLETSIYFTCQNIDSDIYINNTMMRGMQFSIFSIQQIDVSNISLDIPIETDYTIRVNEVNYDYIRTTEYLYEVENQTYVPSAFPYYLYQCYRGTNWNKMKELYKDLEEKIKIDPIAREESDAFLNYREMYLEDFKKISKEDLPIFYLYNVTIWFGVSDEFELSTSVSEKFQTITFNIGEKSYKQDIGEVRIHTESFPENITPHHKENSNLDNLFVVPLGIDSCPYGDGMMCEVVQCFQAKKDLKVTNLYLYESDLDVLGAHVIISAEDPTGLQEETTISSKNVEPMDFYWDCKTPFDVVQGSYVTIELIFKDSRLIEVFEYGGRIYPIMEYIVENNPYTLQTELIMDRLNKYDYWLRYAIVFGGLDMESYFNDYYYPVYETWREELPW